MTAPVPASGPPEGYREEVVGTVPGMGESYRRAVAGAARARLRRGRPGLPEIALRHGPVRAEAQRLADYQHLIGAPGTDELPAGFVHVLGFPLSMALLTRDDFPLPLLGLVHVANRVTQARALHLDEELTFTAWADGLRPHRRGTTVDIHLTASVGDDVAWAGVSTYLSKGVDAAGGGGAAEGVAAEGEAAAGPDVRERAESAAEPGPGRHVWSLPADTGRRYAEVSGDRNPIHTSLLGAKAFGFPGRSRTACTPRPVRWPRYPSRGAGHWTGRWSSGSPWCCPPAWCSNSVTSRVAPRGGWSRRAPGRSI